MTRFFLMILKLIWEYVGKHMKYQKPKLSEKTDVLLFSKQNYKVHADIGYTENLMRRRTMVFDTGAGPNCIAHKALPPGTEELIKPSYSIRVV
eukprot:IDg8177t1